MQTLRYVKTFFIGVSILSASLCAQTQASITLKKPQEPNKIIIANWEGPNAPEDQIVYSMVLPSGEMEHRSFTYTFRGSTVMFNEPDTQIFELSYKSHLKGTLATLRVDCRENALSDEGTCQVVPKENDKKTQKHS